LPPLLLFLALCNLCLGSSVFVLGSIVSDIASGLQVSTAATGQAMTAYALATATLAPIALVLSSAWPKRLALLASLGLVALGGLVCALAPTLAWLYLGRIVMGIGAVFSPIAAGIAVASVSPAMRGRALSMVFIGMSLSYVVGIPLGTWLSAEFGWRFTIGLLAGACAFMASLCWFIVPKNIATPAMSWQGAIGLFKLPGMKRILAITLCYFTAIFCVFSYIGPVLKALYPLSPGGLSLTLTLFGVAGMLGTVSGGWANDKFGSKKTMRFQLSGLFLMMLLLPFTKGHYLPMVSALFMWGVCGFGIMAPQQARLATLDMSRAPLLFSLNGSMVYLGTALGAIVGGLSSDWLGFSALAWPASAFALIGLVLLLAPQSSHARRDTPLPPAR
jgi:MFS transporter, DHA1 family, inner membrane transport protein